MKNKFLVLCLVICIIFSMQVIAAENVDVDVLNQTDQLSVDDVDGDVLQAADEGQDVLADIDGDIPWYDHEIIRVGGGNFSSLNKTIQEAPSDSLILFEGDFEFDERTDVMVAIHFIGKSLIIDGQGHTIDAKNKTRIFWFENKNNYVDKSVVFKNIVFKNAYNIDNTDSDTGGAVSLVGNGTFFNCTFINNSAGRAGALYWGYASKAQIFNCTFEDNKALGSGGGAIRIRNNMVNVVIENSTFINNYAPTDGGAIHLSNTQGSRSNSIINCTFINNTAASGGGAILIQAPGCNVTNSTFINNSATIGGAMRWAGYSGTIRNTTFTTNHASSQGGAMHGTGDQPIVILSHFNNNTAGDGAAIWWNDTENGIIANSTFDYNIATGNAGAIHIAGTLCNITYSNFTHNEANNGASIFLDVGAYINECLFEHERAYNDGGAIYLNSVDIDVSQIPQSVLAMLGLFNSTLYNCSAGNDGGAGYIRASGGVVRNVTFLNCSAGHDGGAGYVYGSNGSLINSTFIGNNATSGNGGAVYWYGINGAAYDVKVYNNTAVNGGGIYLSKPEDISIIAGYSNITFSDFSNNTAIDNGGSVYCGGMFSNILYSNFTHDKATNGSGIYLNVGAYIYQCSLFMENATYDGGGIYLRASNTGNIPQAFIDALGDRIGVVSTNITNCTAGHDGGAGYVVGNGGRVHDTNMINCSAGHDGGAGYVSGDYGRLYNSTMINNTAGNDGGALFWEGDGGHVEEITCDNNFADNNGGSIYISGSSVSFDKSNFTATNATNYGGSVYISGNYVNITNSIFERCAANNYHGGAVYITGMNITIAKSNFTMNRVDVTSARGGSIDVLGDNTTIDECIFDRCSAYEGGVVYVNGTGIRIVNSSCNRSLATNGGAFYVRGNNATIKNVTVSNNNATAYGGALYVSGNFANITNSSFMRCIAYDYHGGAVYIIGLNTTISKSFFQMNNATNATNMGRGGSIDVQGNGTDISNCTFMQCSSYEGGVLYVNGTGITIYNCTSMMSSAVDGGAVYIRGNNVTVDKFTISLSNATDYGGAMYVAGDFANITNANITKCVADNFHGGAMYVRGLNTTISKSFFQMNNATNATNMGRGGSIDVQGNGTNISECIFMQCSAYGGGVLYVNGTGITIYNCTSMMSSAVDGGAVYIMGDSVNVTKFNISFSNATGSGGAMYVAGNYNNITYSNFNINNAAGRPDTAHNGGAIYIAGLNTTIAHSYFNTTVAPLGNGGAIYIEGDNATVDNSSFRGAVAILGASVYIEGDNATMKKLTCNNNTALEDGSAIYVAGDFCELHNSTFTNNTALDDSAVYWLGDNGTIYNITCFNNTGVSANGHHSKGGSLSIIGNGTSVDKSSFTQSFAANQAGALYITGNDVNVTNSVFYNSTIRDNENGGTMYILGNRTNVINCSIEMSRATNGGAIYVLGNNVTISGTNITDTNASTSGGAIYILGEYANITGCNVNLTNAFGHTNDGGGAIFIKGNYTSISKSNFTETRANFNNRAIGGALYITGDGVNVTDSNFNNTGANLYGGAIYIAGENTTVKGSNFTNCTVNTGDGGAIYIIGANTTVNRSEFINCSSKENGGAIYCHGENGQILYSTFEDNIAYNGGGALYWQGGQARDAIIGCTFNHNLANNSGGAVYWGYGGTGGLIIDSNFTNNIANVFQQTSTGSGGAIYWDEGIDGYMNNCSFINNTALFILGGTANHHFAGRAGALFWNGVNGTIENSYFRNNTAYANHNTQGGGAIQWDAQGGLINNVTFVNNSAIRGGAIVGTSSTDLVVNNSTFIYNNASAGGAVWLETSERVNFTNNFFEMNDAYTGGAVFFNKGAIYSYFENCTFNSNFAGQAGAIYFTNSNSTVNKSYFYNNYIVDGRGSDKHGGAIRYEGEYNSLINSVFENNTALDWAGAVYWSGAHGQLNNTTFVNNNATNLGGAIYWSGAYGNAYNCTFDSNNALQGSGGGLYWSATSYSKPELGKVANLTFTNNYANDGAGLYWNYKDGYAENLTFINNTANNKGGALYWTSQNGTLINASFENNTASDSGGSVYWSGSVGKLYNITDNYSSANYGGSIYWNGASGDLYLVTINNTHSTNQAGAIHWSSNYGNLTNLTIMNVYSGEGGGVYVGGDGSNVNLVKASFENISTTGSGGTIYWARASGSMYNVTINNSSAGNGGSIYWTGNYGYIFNLTINNTHSNSNNGGAITWTGNYGKIINSTINNTYSGDRGGAIHWTGSNGNLINVSFYNTTANKGNNRQGGAINWDGSNGILTNISIVKSFSSNKGGAIYLAKKANLTNINITNSSSTNGGGGIYVSNDNNGDAVYSNLTNINITNVTTSNYGGGAIYVLISNVNMTNITIFNATANDGGGIFISSSYNILNNVSISNATATNLGGAIRIVSSNNALNKLNITNSTAVQGGAIYIGADRGDLQNINITNSSIKNNNASSNAGAIYYKDVKNSLVFNTTITNNNATQGSAIYAYRSTYALDNVTLLDNQAHSREFTNKEIGTYANGTHYLSGKFRAYDNMLNAIWSDDSSHPTFTNVIYWDADGVNTTSEVPAKNEYEAGQNITIERFDPRLRAPAISTSTVVTDGDGKFTYEFEGEGIPIASFNIYHLEDTYYTELEDSISRNTTIVNITVDDINHGQQTVVKVNLTDGYGNKLSGSVTVTINTTVPTTVTVNVLNGEGSRTITDILNQGTYNATATFTANSTHLGSTNWDMFNVYPVFDLNTTKRVNATVAYIGDLIQYEINVTNHGTDTAFDVKVNETLSPDLELTNDVAGYDRDSGIWTIGDLEGGHTATLTLIVKVINNGTISNHVNITYWGNDTNTSNDNASSPDVTALPVNNFTIIKTNNLTGNTCSAGELVNFTITVTNNGPSNATNVNITDELDSVFEFVRASEGGSEENGVVRWVIERMNNGTTLEFWVVVKVKTNGTYTNTAKINSTENNTGSSNSTQITVTPVNNLTLVKTNNWTDNVGYVNDLVNFTITVTNNGPSNASDVNIVDELNANFEFIEASSGGSHDVDTHKVTWNIDYLVNGTSREVWVVVKVKANGTFENVASVTSAENDTQKANGTEITAKAVNNFAVIKYANITGNIFVYDLVNFTINVTNLGPSNATNVNITDVLPEGMKVLYHGGNVTGEKTTVDGKDIVTWTIRNLNNGEMVSLWVVVNVTTNGTFRNVASVNSTENTTKTDNGTDITVNPVNNFTVIKYANVTGSAFVNDLVNFTINITNNGPSNATNVNIIDVLGPEFEFNVIDSSRGSYDPETHTVSWTIGSLNNGTTESVWVVVRVLTNGTFRNNAKVNSTENNTGTENGTDITVNPAVNLTVVKTTNWTNNIGYAGSLVNFTITVTNNGPSNATNINITDVLDSGFEYVDSNGDRDGNTVKWNIPSLINGTSYEVWVVVKVLNNGTFRNNVAVNSTENTTETENGTEITVNPVNNFTVIKYANITGDIWVNDLVNFTINVTNNGPSNATNVNITDVLGPEFEFNATDGSYDGDTRIVSWNIPALNNGTTVSRWVVVRVITNGTFTNNAKVNSTENTTGTTNGTDIDVKPVNNLTLIKYANVTGHVYVGDLVNFTINVTNYGPSLATNINITDVLPLGLELISHGGNITGENSTDDDGKYIVNWRFESLNSNDMFSVWVVSRVTTNGTFTNTASVNSTENITGTSNDTTIISDPVTNLTIIKYSNVTGSIVVNGLVNFTINVTNHGPSNATNVNITDVLPEGMEVLYHGGNVTGEKSTNNDGRDVVIWRFGTLNKDDMVSVWVVVRVNTNGTFRNVATVNSTENTTETGNGTDITVDPVNNFTVIKYANVTEGVKVNDLVNFTINITNNGPSNATNVNLTDVLGPEFKFEYASSGSSYDEDTRTVTWTISSLNNGTNTSVWVVVKVLTNGTFRNNVKVNSSENNTGSENGTDITVNPFVNLTVVKTTNWTNNVGYAGSLVNFTITVTNNGPSNATNVNLTDVLDVGFVINDTNGHADGNKVIWQIGNLNNGTSFEAWVVVKVMANGTIRNVASVNSTENTTETTNGTEITVNPVNNFTVIKYANITGDIWVNDLVNFTINVTNNGPSNATNVNITDVLGPEFEFNATDGSYDRDTRIVSWNIPALNNGTTASRWVVVRVITNGTFRNVVSVNSTENITDTTNGTEITVKPVNNLTLIKYANVTGNVKVNDLVNFTINVTNHGPSNATNINITDMLPAGLVFVSAGGNVTGENSTVDGRDIVIWKISTLNKDDMVSLWVVVRVTTNGTFTNTAKVNSTENETGTSNETTITSDSVTNLTLIKYANVTGSVMVNSLVNFTINITNLGPSVATNVNITDVLPEGMKVLYYGGDAEGEKSTNGEGRDVVIWRFATLNNDDMRSVWVVVNVTGNGTFRNVASVSSTENTTGTENGTDLEVKPVNNFTVIKYANVTEGVKVNDLVNFTINITNNGPSNATNVNLTDVLGPEFEFNATDGSYNRETRTVTWNIGSMNNGTTASRWVVVRVLTNGTFRNTASVNSTENDTGSENGTAITVNPFVNLTVVKTTNWTNNIGYAGSLVNFTITVTNNGPSNATNVNITDVLDAGFEFNATNGRYVDGHKVIWNIGNLNNGTSYEVWVVVKVLNNGTFRNVASVNSTENSTGTENGTEITVEPVTNLTLIKYANVTGNVKVGDLVNFTINMTNHGPSVATNINITDELPVGMVFVSAGGNVTGENSTVDGRDIVVWRFNSLNCNDMVSVWVVVRVTTNGTFTNVASVNSTENTTGTENGTTITSDSVTNLTLIKYANVTGNVKVYDLVNFTINVTNLGPSNATNVNITDELPDGLVFVCAGGNVTGNKYTIDGKEVVIWTIGNLNKDEMVSLWVVVNVTRDGTFRNTATVNSTENNTGTTNGTDITSDPVTNLTVIKYANVTGNAKVNDLVNFTINVTNNGPSTATNVNISDVLDSSFELIAHEGSYDATTRTITWDIGTLQNNGKASVWVVVRVKNNGTFTNTATVNSTENETGTTNGTDITVEPVTNLTLIKYANVTGNVKVGDLVNFTINMTNYGPSVATHVNITDVLPAGLELVRYGGNATGINFTNGEGRDVVLWTVDTLNSNDMVSVWVIVRVTTNGTFTNIATVNSTENTTGTENGTTITSDSVTNLTLIKHANVTGNVNVYDLVNFTINVTNYGPSNATNVNITDELPDGLVFVSAGGNVTGTKYVINNKEVIIWNVGNLNKDEMVSLWVVVNVTKDGTFRNTATVNSTENTTGTTNGTDITSTPVTNLTVIKYANVTENVRVNDLVNFTINVTNNGPSTATNVNITDVLDSSFELVAHEGSYDEATRTITWNVGTLPNNGEASVWVVVRVKNNGTFTNTATANSTENTSGTTNSTEIKVNPVNNFTLIKYANVTTDINVGDLVNFTINVTNHGPSKATNVNITDSLPTGLAYVTSGSNVTGVNGDIAVGDGKEIVTWNFGSLDDGESVSVWVVVRITVEGVFINNATVNSTENSSGTTNGTQIPSELNVDLEITKTVNTETARYGDVIIYTIKVKNKGPGNATGVNVTEIMSSHVKLIEANPSKGQYDSHRNIWYIGNLDNDDDAQLTLKVQVTYIGIIENSVIISGNENDTNRSNNNYTSKNVTATPADSAVWAPDVTEYYGTPINVPVSSSNALGVIYIIRNSTGQIIAQGSLAVGQGIANLNLDADTYIVYLTTLTDANHYPASYQSKITILKVDSSIKVNTTDITYGDDENITITLPGDVTGTVNITVGDRTYENIPIINGTVNITVPDLAGGNYTVNVTYGGDKNHNGNSTTATFEVARAVPVIKIFVEDIWYGEVEVLNVTVNAPGSVNVTVNGITVTIDLENGVVTTNVLAASGAPNYDGKATWNIIGLNAGTYPAFAIYNGNENYTSVNTTDEFIVRALPTTVTVKADDINVGEDAIISVEVGPANATGNVTITIEGKNYAQTLENGKATFTIPGLKAGTKDVSVSYSGDGNYLPSENATAFDVNKVKPAIDVTSHDIEEGDDETITIHLPDDATGTVTIIVDGKKYTAPVINGKATFTIPGLKPGNYEIKVHYSGDDKYLLVDTTDSFKVSQKDRPHNKTHSDGGIDLTVHQTGNPILYILLILIAFVVIPIRKFKK